MSSKAARMLSKNTRRFMEWNQPLARVYRPPRNVGIMGGLSIRRFCFLAKNPGMVQGTQHNKMKSFSFSSSSAAATPPQEKEVSSRIPLKRLVRPFLLSYHPDRLADCTPQTKAVNLEAIQTLNGMIDTIETIYDRAMDSKYSTTATSKARVELKSSYVIEFLKENPNHLDGVKKAKEAKTSTRRSVALSFDEYDLRSVQTVDANGSYSTKAARTLKIKAMTEIKKLLRIAGLNIPSDLNEEIENLTNDLESDDDDEMTSQEFDFLTDLGLEQYVSRKRHREKTAFEKSRDRFMKRIDWKKHQEMFEKALEDAERDIVTQGLISNNAERRQRMISDVLSKVRIYDRSQDGDGEQPVDGQNDGLDELQQLIAFRRLSLIFDDNFEKLEMEEMGRMWTNCVIVLTPARKGFDSKTGLPFSRVKRTKMMRESGFKFSYNADESVTIYIPIDFKDDELVKELKGHVEDFFSLSLEKDGFEEHFPAYYKDLMNAHIS